MLSSLGESAQFIIQLIVVLGCLFLWCQKGWYGTWYFRWYWINNTCFWV